MCRIRTLLIASPLAFALILMPQLNTQVQASPVLEVSSSCPFHPSALQPHHDNHERIYVQQCAAEAQSMLHARWYGKMTAVETIILPRNWTKKSW